MTRQIKKDSTNIFVEVYIVDDTDGTPELGVVFNSAGIDLNYRRDLAVVTSITEVTLAALTTAHTDGGFLHVANGRYRLDIPDAAFATGVSQVTIGGTVTGMVVLPITIQLVDFDPDDSTRMGLTALPNAAADAVGGLPISDAGGLDLDVKLANTNEITVVRMGALTDWIDGGRLDLLIDAIPTTAMRGTDSAALASVCTEVRLAELAAVNLPADIAAIPTTAMRGTDSAALASVCTEVRLAELAAANLPADVAAVKSETALIVGDTVDIQARLPAALIGGRMNSDVEAILNNTGSPERLHRWLQAGRHGSAQAGTASSITLTSGENANNDFYNGCIIALSSGTGQDQYRVIISYNGTTKVAGIAPNWVVNPIIGTDYVILAMGSANVEAWRSAAVGILNDLDAAGIRSAVGLATANIDTQLADLPTVSEFNARTLVSASYFDPTADVVANVTTVGSVTTKTGYALSATGLDLVLIDGKTLPVATQIMAAACIGIISGAGTGTEVFKGLDKTTTRATVTVDTSGNRSAITYV